MKLIGICESLTELVLLSKQGQDFEVLMWSLVDYLRRLHRRGKLEEALKIMQQPPLIGNSIQDRYLAAVIESLFIEFSVDLPVWISISERIEGIEDFLVPNLKKEEYKILLRQATTLPPFVKRKLWYSDKAMSRY